MKVMDKINSFTIPNAEPGKHYQTASGAEFTVDEKGIAHFTKSTGCVGCDLNWPTFKESNKTLHMVNKGDAIYCMRHQGPGPASTVN